VVAFTDLVRVLLQPPATAPSCSFPDLLLLPVRSNSSPSYSSSCQNFLLFAVELNLYAVDAPMEIVFTSSNLVCE
jgi:hypothetical protein